MIKGFLSGKDKNVYFFFFNFIKANIYVNQKQGMTFWPANFLTEAFVKWNFLCFLFLCCLLVLLAWVTITLGASAVLFIQRFQSAPQQDSILMAGQRGRSALLCLVSRWDAGRWHDLYPCPAKLQNQGVAQASQVLMQSAAHLSRLIWSLLWRAEH